MAKHQPGKHAEVAQRMGSRLPGSNGHANGHRREVPAPLDTVADGPAASGSNGHDANGRFTKGNRCAVGNPFARRMARLRSVLLDAVSDDDLRAVARKLVEQAKGGDTAAAKVLLAYVVGRPAGVVNPDTLDQEEWEQCRAMPDSLSDPALGLLGLNKIGFAEAVRLAWRLVEQGERRLAAAGGDPWPPPPPPTLADRLEVAGEWTPGAPEGQPGGT
jgi:hypothetical protein